MTDLRVCFVGDSYVAGVGDPEHRGWVGRVAARTHRAGRPLTSYALGVRRQTTRDIADRWLSECKARLPADCDGRVVVAFGVNDTTVEGDVPRVPATESVAHLAALMDGVRRMGWPVLMVGPPPIANPAQNERIARLDAAFSSVCRATGIGYVHVVDELSVDPVWMRQVAEGDGAHPGADGYQRLADLIWTHWWTWINSDVPSADLG